MDPRPDVQIAVVDDHYDYAKERQNAIEEWLDWPVKIKSKIFTNADDLIDAFEKDDGEFYDVILTDVYMPSRDDDSDKVGSAEEGGIRIFEWLAEKRKSDPKLFGFVQLRWTTRQSDIRHIFSDYSGREGVQEWFNRFYRETQKSAYYRDGFISQLENTIKMSDPGIRNLNLSPDREGAFQYEVASAAYDEGKQAAESDDPVLIVAEKGLQVEHIARYIHEQSARADETFEVVKCGENRPESVAQLVFGKEHSAGKVEEMKGGTIFFERINLASSQMQWRIAGMIQSGGRFRRTKSSAERQANVRIIASKSDDLDSEELFYCFTHRIRIPPLRERPEDIVRFAEHILRGVANEEGYGRMSFDPYIKYLMEEYSWRGNIAELRSAVRQAAKSLNRKHGTIESLHHFPVESAAGIKEEAPEIPTDAGVTVEQMDPLTKQVWNALWSVDWIHNQAADKLGKTRENVRQHIERRPYFKVWDKRFKEKRKGSGRKAQENDMSAHFDLT